MKLSGKLFNCAVGKEINEEYCFTFLNISLKNLKLFMNF